MSRIDVYDENMPDVGKVLAGDHVMLDRPGFKHDRMVIDADLKVVHTIHADTTDVVIQRWHHVDHWEGSRDPDHVVGWKLSESFRIPRNAAAQLGIAWAILSTEPYR